MSDRISTLLGWFRGRAPCRVTMRTLEMAAVGFMDSNSFCRVGSDCDSGRCEGYTKPQCEARLALGGTCNEHSDCLSDYCAWSYVCENPEDLKSGLGVMSWILIGLVIAAGLFLTFKFVKQRRAGYSEVLSMDV